ncbi:MAG TPA: SDR family NAD(P)-dependent oxidoreductase [Candidatus Sulfotelmatobacter sp.]|nr:SDR family NAD(P)-dependent oxidoreductase [Candidatus Sulfotelmatobacter sp.]
MTEDVVVITGANGGLGSYVTRAFLDAGATVVGTSRKIEQSKFAHPGFAAIPADITTRSGAGELITQIMAQFGKIRVLVHTVGGFAGGQTVAETDDATMQKMMDLNFHSLFHTASAAIPALRASGNGRLIAIGSRAAVDPGPGVGAYSASKAAMVSLVKTIAMENRDAGLQANTILPGTIDTPANRKDMPNADFSKWVHPAAIASLILWLAGDAGKNINGASIPIYGKDF